MQTMIVGAGAMGSLFASLLSRAGAEVALVERDPAVVRAIGSTGLRVEGVSGAHALPVPITAEPPAKGAAELVIVFVKAPHTAAAAAAIKPVMGPRTVVLSLQDGIGHQEALAEALGRDHVLVGVTGLGASLLAPGHVLHTSWGDTTLAPLGSGATERAEAVTVFFTRHGIKTTVADDPQGLLWGRVLLHVGIGAITSLARVRNGRLLENAAARELMRAAVAEAAAVIRVAGIKLPYHDPVVEIEQMVRRTADSLSAMLQDLYKGRETEIDFLNGAVVRLAEEYGLEAPINRTLMLLIKTAETAT